MNISTKIVSFSVVILLCSVTLSAVLAADNYSGIGAVSYYPGKNQENQMHSSRFRRSLRLDRAWTRSGYGVVFVYANTFDEYELKKIKTAVYEIRKHSCFAVSLRSEYNFWKGDFRKFPNYVFIEKNRSIGCGQSYVGMKGGYQLLTLNPDPNCLTVGTIMHELLHALGIEHEQSRPDRNQYVQVNRHNVEHGLDNVFSIAHGSSPYGPYDFDSVMHYGRFAFSSYPDLPTLSSKVPGYYVPASMNNHLSHWDRRKINLITGCKAKS